MALSSSSRLQDLFSGVLALCAVVAVVSMLSRREGATVRGATAASGPPLAVANWEELVRDGHWMGDQGAPVVVVEFADFQCPAFRHFTNNVLRPFIDDNPGSVAVVFRHWPLSYHPFAHSAARAAECADAQGRFQQFHDRLYEVQDSLGAKPFIEIAREVGVSDTARFAACTAEEGVLARIEHDLLVAEALGGRGTPTVLVNGFRFQSIPNRQTLDSILAEVPAGGRQ